MNWSDILDLENGWFDGGGISPNKSKIIFLMEKMKKYPNIKYPSIVPTQEGNIVFEWNTPTIRVGANYPSLDIDLESMEGLYNCDLRFGKHSIEVDQYFDLNKNEEWDSLFDLLQDHIEC